MESIRSFNQIEPSLWSGAVSISWCSSTISAMQSLNALSLKLSIDNRLLLAMIFDNAFGTKITVEYQMNISTVFKRNGEKLTIANPSLVLLLGAFPLSDKGSRPDYFLLPLVDDLLCRVV